MTNITILVGAMCAVLGVWGIVATWPLMRQAAIVVALAVLTLGGMLAMLIGLSELVDRRNRQRNASTGTEPRT